MDSEPPDEAAEFDRAAQLIVLDAPVRDAVLRVEDRATERDIAFQRGIDRLRNDSGRQFAAILEVDRNGAVNRPDCSAVA